MKSSYAKQALYDLALNIKAIIKVVAAAAIGLAVLWSLSQARMGARSPYEIKEFRKALPPAAATSTAPEVRAVDEAAGRVASRSKEIDSRDELVEALMPEVMAAADFPRAEKVVTAPDKKPASDGHDETIRNSRATLETKEKAIETQRLAVEKLHSDMAEKEAAVARAQRDLAKAETALTEGSPEPKQLYLANAKLDDARAEENSARAQLSSISSRIDSANEQLTGDLERDQEQLKTLADLEKKRATAQRRLNNAEEQAAEVTAQLHIRKTAAPEVLTLKNDVSNARSFLANASGAATDAAAKVNAAVVELDGRIRERNFEADHLNLELAALHDRQLAFISNATKLIDETIAVRKAAIEKSAIKKSKPYDAWSQFSGVIAESRKPSSPNHILYEAFRLLCIALVALGIAFCAAILLKVLYPSAAEKWSGKFEELAEKAHPSEGAKSPAANLLMSVATVGIGVFAAAHVMREPGSILYDAAETVPFIRSEAPVPTVPSPTVQNAGSTMTPYSSLNPTFAFNPTVAVSPAPVSLSPMTQFQPPVINVPPAQITTVLPDLKDDINKIASATEATNDTARELKTAFDNEKSKAELLKTSVEDTGHAIGEMSSLVNTEGFLTRLNLADFAAVNQERQFIFARQESLSGTHKWWRSLLALGRYEVTEGTLVLFGTEKGCSEKDYHEQLRQALVSLQHDTPRYEAPFETAIIQRMIGPPNFSNPKFVAARDEVRRHLPVILQASRIAE